MAISPYTLTKSISLTDFMPPFTDAGKVALWPWEKLATVKTTKRAQEQIYGWYGLPPAQKTNTGAPGYYDEIGELDSMTITISKYTIGSVVLDEFVEDNRHFRGFMQKLGKSMGMSHSYAVSAAVAQRFNRAFNSAYPVFDGAALCSTHTLADGTTTVSNVATAASINFDNVWAMLNYFESTQRAQNGMYMYEKPKYILFHPSKWKLVRKVLDATGEPDTADNNPNSLKDYGLIPIPCRFLSTNYWFIIGENFPDTFYFFWSRRLRKETERDIDRGGTKIMTSSRWGFGIVNWQSIVGNQGA